MRSAEGAGKSGRRRRTARGADYVCDPESAEGAGKSGRRRRTARGLKSDGKRGKSKKSGKRGKRGKHGSGCKQRKGEYLDDEEKNLLGQSI